MIKIFVFGSNEAGRHGAGAAKRARLAYGAEYGKGRGLQGNSYAIPTKDRKLKTLPLSIVRNYVEEFKKFACTNTNKDFYVTAVGTGLAGFSHEDIAPLFKGSTDNCIFPDKWKKYLGDTYKYFSGNL